MKFKKLLVSLASVFAVASACMVTTYAAEARIELDTARTTETSKVIKVYCGDITGGIWGGQVTLSFAPVNTDDTLTITKAWFDQEQDNHPTDLTNDTQRWNANNATYTEQVTYWGAETYVGDWFGTYVITVPEGSPAFTVTATCDFSDENYGSVPKTLVANIPAWSTAVTKPATPVATYTDGEDYDVQTFKATIAAADVAKTLTWTVTANGNSTDPVPANIDTNIGGDIEEVLIGLIVQGPSAASATATITVE